MQLIREKGKKEKTVYYGFSLGAYALMELATKMNFYKIVLVSPSPLFKETIKKIKDEYVKEDNGDKTIKEMCKKITCPVSVYVGELERDLMKSTALSIANNLGVQLIVVKGLGHEERLFKKVLRIESGV